MDEIKPTWKLAWGLWWRIFLITLGVYAVIGGILWLIVLLLGVSLITWAIPFGGL